MNECCKENSQERFDQANPPGSFPFVMRFFECGVCKKTHTTTKQRRKNRKNYNQAYKKYINSPYYHEFIPPKSIYSS